MSQEAAYGQARYLKGLLRKAQDANILTPEQRIELGAQIDECTEALDTIVKLMEKVQPLFTTVTQDVMQVISESATAKRNNETAPNG